MTKVITNNMIKTEKKHWVNGYQIRGGYFKTFNLSIFNRGVMFSYPVAKKIEVRFYKLI